MRKLAIDIVVPVYNEEGVFADVHEQLTEVLKPLRSDHEVTIYYVNDGSTDETGAALLKIAAADRAVTVLELSRNFGHQAAFATPNGAAGH